MKTRLNPSLRALLTILLWATTVLATAAPPFQILRDFGILQNVTGTYPLNSPVLAPDGKLYGTTQGEGNVYGTIYRINADGTGFTVLKRVTLATEGVSPVGGVTVSGTTLYGVTQSGGAAGNGAVFKVETDGTGYAVLKSFTYGEGYYGCQARLLLSGSTLYGTAPYGGSSGYGVVFKINTDGTGFTILHSFSAGTYNPGTGSYINSDGMTPMGSLEISGTTLYGTTSQGGDSGYGTVFKVNTDGTGFALLKVFSGSDGQQPIAGLAVSSSALYGTTLSGGPNGYGTIFKINTDGTGFTVLKNLTFYTSDGASPYARVIVSGSTLYGTTQSGGSPGYGTVFRLNTDGTGYTLLKSFANSDGAYPAADLTLVGSTLIGAAKSGGSANVGTLFRLTTDGTGFATIPSFTVSDAVGPLSQPVLSGSALYGTASGGNAGKGTVYKVNLDGSGYTVLKHLTDSDGAWPFSRLLVSGTVLYGTTSAGGSSGFGGTVFRMNMDGTAYTVLKTFTGSDGSNPYGGLVLSGSTLYGTTTYGGSGGYGTVFKVNIDGTGYAVLKSFSSSDGSNPYADLVFSANRLYGTTQNGGSSGYGVVFGLNTDGSGYTVLKTFAGPDGQYPYGGVALSNGTLYGCTVQGGTGGYGTIFKINTDGSGFVVLKNMVSYLTDGVNPYGNLLISGTRIFGTTYSGGSSGSGCAFEMNTDGTGYQILKRFAGVDGANPHAGLSLSSSTLYGTTQRGGAMNEGTVFSVSLAPILAIASTSVSAMEGGLATQSGTFVDVEGNNTVSLSASLGTVTKNDAAGTWSWSYTPPNGPASTTVTITADDGVNPTVSTNFTLQVSNVAPSFELGADELLDQSVHGVLSRGPISFTDPGADSWTGIVDYGDGSGQQYLAIDPAKSFTLAHTYVSPGSFTVTVHLDDGDGGTASDSFVVNVVLNTAPTTANPLPDQVGQYGSPFNFTFAADAFSDPDDGQTLSYSASGLPSGVVFDGVTRTFSGTPAAVGTFLVQVVATDNGSPALSATNGFALVIGKATPIVTWSNPPDIMQGIALSDAQLNATANVPGVFVYSPAAGTVPGIGNGRVLTTTFTPTDAVDYNTASASASINIYESLPSGFRYERIVSIDSASESGKEPSQPLLQGSDGVLYGTIIFGGLNNGGTLFRVNRDGSGFTILHRFTGQSGDGLIPSGKPLEASDGALYGVTSNGGAYGGGSIYRIARDGTGYAVVYSFAYGSNPNTSLVETPEGLLYGTSYHGGSANAGIIFKLNKDGSGFGVVREFSGLASEGINPIAALVLGSDGELYGTTQGGGSGGLGTVFKMNKDGSDYLVLHSFNGLNGDGSTPVGNLIEASDGALYGATMSAGTGGCGTVFKMNKDGSNYVVLHSFGYLAGEGRFPFGGVIEGSDGGIYGTTYYGGSADGGTAFRMNKDGSGYLIIVSFTGLNGDCKNPRCALTQGSDGNFYGPTEWGGDTGLGTIFRLIPGNHAPALVNAIPTQNPTYGTSFGFTLPAGMFSEVDSAQTLAYTVAGLPAGLSFNPNSRTISGTPTVPGTSTVTVTATDNGSPQLSASTSFDIVVGKATLTATGDRLNRFYGEPNPQLTGTVTGVVNGDNITASYSTTAVPSSDCGVYTVYVTLNDPDNRLGNYAVTTTTGALYINPAPQTITFGTLPAHAVGDAPFTVPVSASSGLPVTLTSSVQGVATISGNTLTILGAGTTTLAAYQQGDANHQAATPVVVNYSIAKGTPVITWAPPADINCRTVLGSAQLNALANVPGTFAYSPPAGSTMALGLGQVLTANFTPTDTVNYNPVTTTRTINVRLDAGLRVGWQQIVGYNLISVSVDPAGNVVAVGFLFANSSTGVNYYVAKYAGQDGHLLWETQYDGPAHGFDETTAAALDSQGNVLVTGFSYNANGHAEYFTAKFASADGSLLWGQRYGGDGTGDNTAWGLALDRDGNAAVTGTSWNGGHPDFYTAKYRGSDGTLLWEHRSTGSFDFANAVACDANGNVLVSGTTVDGSGNDYYVAKYAAADGTLVWEQRYAGPTHGNNQPTAMALDPNGNVLVTGYSSSTGSFGAYDFCTVKFAAADGSLLWAKRFSNAGNLNDTPYDLKVDSNGDVVVAGEVANGTSWDYYTAKYAGADGSLLWEHRLPNLLTYQEVPPCLAFDSNRNVIFTGQIHHADGTTEECTTSYASADGAGLWEYRSLSNGARRPIAVNSQNDVVTTGHGTVLYHPGVPPTVTLVGPASLSVGQGGSFTDPGATALDGCGASLTVSVAGGVNLQVPGNYTLTYSATDGAGQTASATRIVTVFVTDHPPVAVAGPDQTLYAGANCAATLRLDGSGSSDQDGDVLSYSWVIYTQTPSGPVASTPVSGAVTTWTVSAGNYEAELTVSTTVNGQTVSATDRAVITVLPSAPVLSALSPAAAYAGGQAFTLSVTGGCFQPGAIVYWNGSARATIVVNSSQLTASILASDLVSTAEIANASVTVVNGDGQVSNPLAFSIVAQSVGTVDTSVITSGGTATVSTAPTTAGDPGVAVVVQNTGGGAVTVAAATYDTKPVGETAFRIDNGNYVDVQITGADSADVATVYFYYPSTITGNQESKVKLRYFDGANWITVLSSGGVAPLKDTTDNLDNTISGGRFTVIFDNTSTPKITQLSGTVFGMFDPTPEIISVSGPTGPLALGTEATLSVQYATLGDPSAPRITFLWDDGGQTTVAPSQPGLASATRTYVAAGVYTVGVTVSDPETGQASTNFNYVVVYDPSAGFVTGGGWINSPLGSFAPDPSLTGKATFGFVSKYLKGKTVPTGETEFQFALANFHFNSTVYEWLVVSGALAQYKGSGTINGAGNYGFLLTATDGQISGGGGLDKFRIKIWDKATGTVIYDNVMGASDDINSANPEVISGGSIVIQKAK